ncbi:hypothetical protein [Paraburkholderia bonniea]|uniref:hypothetical protein n=1 Tax=Paraburkholderia bonniea TaxID=2152891 RepID=UPI0012927906|nr:hypothetical protein [Paraburkholderia bonniea]
MFRRRSLPLPISRSPLISLAGFALAVLFAVSSLALAQERPAPPLLEPSSLADASLAPVPAQDHQKAGEGEEQSATAPAATTTSFGARQVVLDHRSEENNYRYAVAQHNCYSKFFVNHCLNKARNAMRSVQADIRKEQLALDDEQRVARAYQRDQQAALTQARNEAEAPQRAAEDARNAQAYEDKQRQHALDLAQRNAEMPQRAANEQAYQDKQRQHLLEQAQRGNNTPQHAASQAAYDQKQAEFQRKLDAARKEGAQKAQERIQNEQRFQQKQADAAQHKADIEARQKQAAEKARQKQEQQQKQ